MFCVERMREGEHIQAEGGAIVIFNPNGDSAIMERIREMAASCGRSTDFFIPKY